MNLKLYLVLESKMLKMPLKEFLHQVIEAGVTAIQLRDKGEYGKSLYNTALVVKNNINKETLFIVNDRLDIAVLAGADGVHLGVNDLPIDIARKHYPNLILGYSCNNLDDVEMTNRYADYAGIGAAYNTSTKQDIRGVLGLEGVKQLNDKLKKPSVAIGGINLDNAYDVIQTGVTGLALSSYICESATPYETVRKLIAIGEK